VPSKGTLADAATLITLRRRQAAPDGCSNCCYVECPALTSRYPCPPLVRMRGHAWTVAQVFTPLRGRPVAGKSVAPSGADPSRASAPSSALRDLRARTRPGTTPSVQRATLANCHSPSRSHERSGVPGNFTSPSPKNACRARREAVRRSPTPRALPASRIARFACGAT
jgi:hypothetical protein